MRQQIIDGILAGEPLRAIGARVVPPVHHSSISRFKLDLLRPAVTKLRGVSPERNIIKELALSTGINGDAGEHGDNARETVRQNIHDRVHSLDSRLEAWISDAERANDGKPLHPALAAHSRNILSSLELRAKLAGLLQDGTNGTTINVAVMASSPGQPADAQPVVDVTFSSSK